MKSEPLCCHLSPPSSIIGVFIGLKVASTDPFFQELEDSRRKALLVKDLSKAKMANVVNKKTLARRIKITALFMRPWRILIGGGFAALGVLSMHYMGMMALRTNADTKFHPPQIAISSIIAQTTATAAFWILFRALTFRPASTTLRVLSAVIMGFAVCGTHYSGMWATEFLHSEENYALKAKYTIHGDSTSSVASHLSLLLCFWITCLGSNTASEHANLIRYRNQEDKSVRAKYEQSTRHLTPATSQNSAAMKKIHIIQIDTPLP